MLEKNCAWSLILIISSDSLPVLPDRATAKHSTHAAAVSGLVLRAAKSGGLL